MQPYRAIRSHQDISRCSGQAPESLRSPQAVGAADEFKNVASIRQHVVEAGHHDNAVSLLCQGNDILPENSLPCVSLGKVKLAAELPVIDAVDSPSLVLRLWPRDWASFRIGVFVKLSTKRCSYSCRSQLKRARSCVSLGEHLGSWA